MSTIHMIAGDTVTVGATLYNVTRPTTWQVGEVITYERMQRDGLVRVVVRSAARLRDPDKRRARNKRRRERSKGR